MDNSGLAAKAIEGFYLTVVAPTGTSTRHVPSESLSVGKSPNCNLSISDDSVNDLHLTVTVKDGQFWVEDQASIHGSFLNGQKLEPGKKTPINSGDWLKLGVADYKLAFSLEQPKPNLQLVVENPKPAAPPPAPPTDKPITFSEHDIVREAHKIAALILNDAESEAERRAEEVYLKALAAQSRAEEAGQKITLNAYAEAEVVFKRANDDAHQILANARKHAVDIRRGAEGYVQELRLRTEKDCDGLLQNAQQTARAMQEDKSREAEAYLKRREEEILTEANDAIREREAGIERELQERMDIKRAGLEQEFADRILQFDRDYQSDLEKAKALKQAIKDSESQLAELQGKAAGNAANLKTQMDELAALQSRHDEAKRVADPLIQKVAGLQAEAKRLADGQAAATKSAQDAQENLKRVLERSHATGETAKEKQKEYEASIADLRTKLEVEKTKITNEEHKFFEDAKLQSARKLTVLEQSMLEEISEKRHKLVREMMLRTETFFAENASAKGPDLKPLAEQFTALLNVSTNGKADDSKVKLVSAVGLRRQQRLVAGFIGGVLGAAAMVVAAVGYDDFYNSKGRLLAKVAQVQQERELDLQRRKFNPPQTSEIRETYCDSVLYTKDFTALYLNDDYQKKLLKRAAPYMFKTWRIDEDKVIQLQGMSVALVKNLEEKRNAIHPDFVKQSLDKMKETESEVRVRMRELLGSQVRLESFRKLENDFFREYQKPQDN